MGYVSLQEGNSTNLPTYEVDLGTPGDGVSSRENR